MTQPSISTIRQATELVVRLALIVALWVPRHDCGYVCKSSDSVCQILLIVDEKLTMMHGSDLVYPSEGKLYRYDVTNTSSATPVPPDDVITADGFAEPRLVVVANDSMPGPTIRVYEGQTVIIRVKNRLLSDSTSIHIHGLPQLGTPWMDGVPYVTQCPTTPGQSFTYRFKATPKGTYWYHSHVGPQRTMGLFGAFVISPKPGSDDLLRYEEEEFVISLQDWNPKREADFGYQQMKTNIFIGRKKYKMTSSLDGGKFSKFYMTSGLINGRGRYYDPNTGTHNGAPLAKFVVRHGKKYRFRVIGAGELYPFRFSVDGHPLEVIASDGYEIKPTIVESFIINPGERYDFILTANNTVDNYRIRAKTLEIEYDHKAEAVLNYDGANDDTEPTSRRKNCSVSDRCLVLNCPFAFYPEDTNTDCTFVDNLRSRDDAVVPPVSQGKFKEYFLNFAMPNGMATINGRVFKFPTVSALTQPTEIETPCPVADCGEDRVCLCTNSVSFEKGDTVQFVFTNMGIGQGFVHPIHSHGHSFYVLKMGYGNYNQTTGAFISPNTDIDCRGNLSSTWCNNATWSDPSWLGGNVPGLIAENAPRKDTIIVPSGGYVVLRILADNPGLWIMHCHIDMHTLDGMVMLLNESFADVPPPPMGFPTCHSFHLSESGLSTGDNPTYPQQSGGADTGSI